MAVTSYTPLLGLALPTTGDLSGTWGTTANNSITSLIDTGVAGTTTLSSDTDVTLSTTDGAANQARSAVILWTASGTTTRNITAPAHSKAYIVINATGGTQSVVIRGAGPTTGVTVPAGKKYLVAWNGSDFVKIASTNVDLANDVTGTLGTANGGTGLTGFTAANNALYSTSSSALAAGTLPIAAGGTGQTTASAAFNGLSPVTTKGDLIVGSGSNTTARLGIGTDTYILTADSAATNGLKWAAPATGTVTSVSVSSSNGFAGTSSGGATPALTLSTTITGMLKGNGTAISAGTAGTDYVAPGTATTFTATQTFTGSSSALAAVFSNAAETTTVSATAATGTINYDVTTQSVLYYTTNASGTFVVNLRASSGTSMNTALGTGQSVTAAFLVAQGASGASYYNTSVQVDGTTSGVTTKWQGGAPIAGNASGIDVYTYTVIKTGSATFTVLASLVQFK